jgi:hypothetical protein
MTKLAALAALAALLPLAACVDQTATDSDLAIEDSNPVIEAKADAAWESAATLHEGASLFDHAGANARRVHSLWISGSNMNHVPMTIDATAVDGSSVRIAVLGPLENGVRPVLAADGYTTSKRSVHATLDVSKPGEHLIVVGSYNLASDTSYTLSASCPGPDGCGVSRYDGLATPKSGALVGDSQRLVSMLLGDVMVGHPYDVQVELWASPPMQSWNATKVGTSTASGLQVNAILPTSVVAGDDLTLVVKKPGGAILDSGVTVRYAPTKTAFARLDKILYGDIASLQIAGVVGYFEGVAEMRLFSETREMTLADVALHADKPGQEGNGFDSFDATFAPELSRAPHDGEILSVGYINGNGDYKRMGCFEYCNNLSGLSSCTGGPRACP